VLGEDEV